MFYCPFSAQEDSLGGAQASFFSMFFIVTDTVSGYLLLSHLEKQVETLLLSEMLCPSERVFIETLSVFLLLQFLATKSPVPVTSLPV